MPPQCISDPMRFARLDHRYRRIGDDVGAIEDLFADLFLDAHENARQWPPTRITLDLDATDDPIHGHQEVRFFDGYYHGYCYLPHPHLRGRCRAVWVVASRSGALWEATDRDEDARAFFTDPWRGKANVTMRLVDTEQDRFPDMENPMCVDAPRRTARRRHPA